MDLHCNTCLTTDSRWTYILGSPCPNPNCKDGVVEVRPTHAELVDVLPEPMTCGRRMQDLGPWPHEEGLDRWERFKSNGDRVCSFCGSLHFEDFARLVRAALEVPEDIPYGHAVRIEPSTKSYKVYVHQPGVRNASEGGMKFYMHHVPRNDDGSLAVTTEQNQQYAQAIRVSKAAFNRMIMEGRRAV